MAVPSLRESSVGAARQASGIEKILEFPSQVFKGFLNLLVLSREWENGMIFNSQYRSFPHSLLRTNILSILTFFMKVIKLPPSNSR